MKHINVCTSKTYDVIVGNGLICNAASYLQKVIAGKRIAIISDSNVWSVYGENLQNSLEACGYSIAYYVIPPGEQSKNGDTYLRILNFCAESKLTRKDCIIALGGGVVGDIAGFVSATYLRGISYVQIPTSLLAMVDSSVGGKTAINLPTGKNLAGAFYQPNLVLCDLQALNTLPDEVFRDGCAEVIKYGILFDTELFDHLYQFGCKFDREYVITRCIELKKDVVEHDERDLGDRQLLNLGHTLGHSIETLSNYSISHGKAVAIGINLISAGAASEGICSAEAFSRIHAILEKFGLPTKTSYPAQLLLDAAMHDKKLGSKALSFILPTTIGKCVIYPYPIENLESFIKAGLTYADHCISR